MSDDARTLVFTSHQMKHEIKSELPETVEVIIDSVLQLKYEDSLEQYGDSAEDIDIANIKIEKEIEMVKNGANAFADSDVDDSDVEKDHLAASDSDLGSTCGERSERDDDIKEEISENESVINNGDWHKIVPCPSTSNIISETSKFNFDAHSIQNPVDVYNLFLTDEIVDLIVEETNTYAQWLVSQSLTARSRLHFWFDTNRNEIRNFFAIIIAMGLVHLPSVNMYWSKENMFRNDFISNIMGRDRFLLLLRCLHFCKNQNDDLLRDSGLHNIENLLRPLNANFRSVLIPGRNLIIADSVIYHSPQVDFHSFNKNNKHDIKLYKLCTENGYTNNVIFYIGDKGQPHPQAIVQKLLEPLKEKGDKCIFADSYYSSLPLAKALFEQKMIYCGTLHSNRDIPKSFTKKLRKGQIYSRQNGCLKIIKWMDRHPVLILTTDPSHDNKLVVSNDILKPKCILDYNSARKGVAFSDQKLSYHSVLCKGLKWPWNKLAFELLFGVAVVNSWIIYNEIFSTSKISIIDFRRMLAKELVTTQNINCDSKPSNKRALHIFVKPAGPGRKKRKMCTECYKELRLTYSSRETTNKVPKVTSFCQDCDGQPGFCLPCFNKFHKT